MYGGTKTEMERLLRDATKLTGVKYDINNLSDVYEAIHAVQGELGITGTTAQEASTTIAGSFSAMKASFQNALGAIALGEGITPALEGLASTVSTFLFGNLFPMIGNIIMTLPMAIGTFLQTAAPLFIEQGAAMIGQIGEGLSTGLPVFFEQVNQFIQNTITFIQEQLPSFLEQGVSAITEFANGILSNMPEVIKSIGEILNGVLTAILEAAPVFIENGFELIGNLAQGFMDNLPAIMESITTIIGDVIQTLTDYLPDLLAKGIEMIGSLAQGVWDNLPEIISTIVEVVSNIIQELGEHLPEFLEKGVEFIGEMASGLIEAIPDIVAKVPEIVVAIVEGFANLVSDFVEVGAQLMAGLADGIVGAIGGLIDSAIGAGQDLLDGVCGFFGINSPSKVFMGIGEFLDMGLAEGIEDNIKPISNAVKDIEEAAIPNIEDSMSYDIASTIKNGTYDMLASGIQDDSTHRITPVHLTINLGRESFDRFIEDITKAQGEELDLKLSY